MTLKEAIRLLTESGVEDAAHDAREIFSEIGRIPRHELVPGDAVADAETEAAIMRRASREPLQYITGTVDFYRERYKVSPDCLIPRQETELLVDLAVRLLPEGASFLDICTGSGCIAVSTLKNTVDTKAVALDISEGALGLAKQNAKENGIIDRITFILGDALSCAVNDDYFAVLSNPPYVTEVAYSQTSPELTHEPRIALVGGGKDGADFYRRITELYSGRIPRNGFILYEIGYDQGEILRRIAADYSMSAEIIKDYSGLDRMALLKPLR